MLVLVNGSECTSGRTVAWTSGRCDASVYGRVRQMSESLESNESSEGRMAKWVRTRNAHAHAHEEENVVMCFRFRAQHLNFMHFSSLQFVGSALYIYI